MVLQALGQYELPLLRYAQRLLKDESLARDVVQHVFLRLCDHAEGIEKANLRPWLYAVCRNRAFDLLRKAKHNAPIEAASHMAADDTGPVVAAEQAETSRLLYALVETLPPAQAEAVHLWASGFTYREISAVTKRREPSIRVLVHRGITSLREHPGVVALLCDTATSEP